MPLIQLFWQMCWLQKGPQDVPVSQFLLQIMLIIYFVINSALMIMLEDSVQQAAIVSLLEVALLFGSVKGILAFSSFPERFNQTMVAILGTSLMMSVIIVFVLLWIKHSAPGDNGAFVKLFVEIVTAWSFVVTGHIFRHALQTVLFVGILVGFVTMLFIAQILYSLSL